MNDFNLVGNNKIKASLFMILHSSLLNGVRYLI